MPPGGPPRPPWAQPASPSPAAVTMKSITVLTMSPSRFIAVELNPNSLRDFAGEARNCNSADTKEWADKMRHEACARLWSFGTSAAHTPRRTMTASEPHILIVDDHREIRDVVSRYLRENGFRTSAAESAGAARRILASNAIDLAVVDVMMPGEDGLAFTRSLRAAGAMPVIMLTARGEDVDRIVGLEMGADDYMAKPFNPRELLARVAAVLRRARGSAQGTTVAAARRIRFASWTLDINRRELVSAVGTVLPLSAGEFRLLLAFLERPNMALTRDQLLDIARGRSMEAFDRSIDSAISRLRRKIEADPRDPQIIKTVWGDGYMFTEQPESA